MSVSAFGAVDPIRFLLVTSITTITRFHTHRLPRFAARKCRLHWPAQGICMPGDGRQSPKNWGILDVYAALSALRLRAFQASQASHIQELKLLEGVFDETVSEMKTRYAENPANEAE